MADRAMETQRRCSGEGDELSPAAAAAGVDGAAADAEKQMNVEKICVLVMPFLPLHLLVPLSQKTWQEAAAFQTRLVIDCDTTADDDYWQWTKGLVFWQRLPLDFVIRIAARLTHLREITLRHPRFCLMWCIDAFLTFIETTAALPTPTEQLGSHGAPQQSASQRGGALQTIAFDSVGLTVAELRKLKRSNPDLPPPVTPAPTLPSLKSVTGALREHRVLADRGWRMPALERVELNGWAADELGRFISSSSSLKEVERRCWTWGEWATAFERMPVAPCGQPGPLGHLQTMRGIGYVHEPFMESVQEYRIGIKRLRTRLVIDCDTTADDDYWQWTKGLVFWQRLPLDFVMRIAARLTHLREITLRHPRFCLMWCIDAFLTFIETTAALPTPAEPLSSHGAPQQSASQRGGALQTIAFESVGLTVAELRKLKRSNPDLPPPVTPAPTLPSLKGVTGALREHRVLADRGWRMPALERVEQPRPPIAPSFAPPADPPCPQDRYRSRPTAPCPSRQKLAHARTRAAAFQTRLVIDCDTTADDDYWQWTKGLVFWQRLPLDFVMRIAARLTHLREITLRHPRFCLMWCIDAFLTFIETTAALPTPAEPLSSHGAPQQSASQRGGALQTIAFESVGLTVAELRKLKRSNPDLPPPVTPAPTLPSLKGVTGALREHRVLADRGWRMPALERVEQPRVARQHRVLADRSWHMPALEYVDQEGWDVETLGRFISSSSSLKEVERRCWTWGEWATAFERMPVAPVGQPGPLGHLQTMRGIGYVHEPFMESVQEYRIGIKRLQGVLTSRGCRKALTRLDVEIPPFENHHSLSALLDVDGFVSTCCARPDVPVPTTVEKYASFELSLFYADDFPARPSRFIKTAIQEAAKQARYVTYTISQQDLTHPVDSPSQTTIDIVNSLSFDKAHIVTVENARGFVPLPGTPSRASAIIEHLQQFPTAEDPCSLWVRSSVGGTPGRLLAQKMPREVGTVPFDQDESREDRRLMLEALGEGREVRTVRVGHWKGDPISLAHRGPFEGWGSPGSPAIRDIHIDFSVSDELEPLAAAELVRDSLATLLNAGVRGLRRVVVLLPMQHDLDGAIRQLLPDKVEIGDFTIITDPRRTRWTVVEAHRIG
ncbi:unnamed protein product [Vitrella brassicaformis CCMP3155]|uniref:Uncharacterized protein n=1 Tax=Vitrella brassicaformis (strain CCMP3155) TaxID=1169540 RepID=A0A0G4EBR9_VITBC|nr:unnamed protein product [Vitrella brassicaformis CCMP3155]|eukprot:CEL93423.1 unnamed protein product [Vitrella brassicaformis CCMP3155]